MLQYNCNDLSGSEDILMKDPYISLLVARVLKSLFQEGEFSLRVSGLEKKKIETWCQSEEYLSPKKIGHTVLVSTGKTRAETMVGQ